MTADIHRNTLQLFIYPGAARNEVIGLSDGILKVRVAAPPVKGKANRELTAFLSRALGVSKSSLTIVKGHTSRHKVISVEGMTREDIIRRLTS